LPAFSRFHFSGYRISFNELADALRQASNRDVKVRAFPWWLMRLIAPFAPIVRSLMEMRYLWQHEVNLDGSKLERFLGRKVEITPLSQALKESGIVNM